MSNHIITLLSKDILTGKNYKKWKSNLNIVFVSKSIRYVLTKPIPPLPNNNSTHETREDFDR